MPAAEDRVRADAGRRVAPAAVATEVAGGRDGTGLWATMATAPAGSAERSAAREELVRLHLPLVEHCARRFCHRGEPLEDLVQVGAIGLLKSIDGFEPGRGVEFSTYATPKILGEVRRHFRDRGWTVRVPRRLQELRWQIRGLSADLTQILGRSPTPYELAERIGCGVAEILEALTSGDAYSTISLDADDAAGSAGPLHGVIGVEDEGLGRVETLVSIRPVLDGLSERERRILLLRLFRDMSQTQIATEIGLSQMQVSRLLARTLGRLRAALEVEAG